MAKSFGITTGGPELLIRSLVISHVMLATYLLKRLLTDCHVALLMTSLVTDGPSCFMQPDALNHVVRLIERVLFYG
jgi:hypothetical protein